ncbi:signal peptide peptidase [Aspergillus heteromorphus CBS 117.55]|uniref:Signal peptide peptidase n=1 Tax=Aspergillus heteromorphus CBS 117.55 TaxID=1448321 RepID=A0A317WBE3_9EURO|nr:signal peptide peptidase [Aspergillus heteromorphus CBS 117.55]PWY83519.1 signal peptide peptidase [Aspergillus heteromorphus CBS 117.55]
MDEVSPLAEFLGQAIYQFTAIKPLLPTYGHLLVSALFPIYIGAHASLSKPSSAAKPPKGSQEDGYESDNEEEGPGNDRKMEGLVPSDALMFPLTAGLTLGGLYLVIKYMGAELLNKILGFYFSQMGILFAVAFLKDSLSVFRSFIFPRKYSSSGRAWKPKPSERKFEGARGEDTESLEVRHSPLPGLLGAIPLPNTIRAVLWALRGVVYWRARLRVHVHRVVSAECWLGVLDVLSITMALPAIGYFTFVTKPWWLTNFLGFSFCYGTLQFMSPSTFVTGSLILGSLFFYDIYFVYFTPLMVTVAKKLDVPIKLLFPRPAGPGEAPDTISLAMLGLGDIIIPGMMIGLALRFDLYLYYKRKGMQKAQAEGNGLDFVKPVYQIATGGWGERFWTRSVTPKTPEVEPPYHNARSFPKPYFTASIIGYVFGMIATLVVMQIFDHPQPALLYLVPGVLISLWGTALVRRELNEMWEFSDAEEEEEEDENASEKKDDKKEPTEPAKQGGFFSRLFGNEAPSETSKKTEERKPEASSSGEESQDQETEKKDSDEKKDDDSKNFELFTISLYHPRKSDSETSRSRSPSENSKPTEDDENWSIVGGTERDVEPPAKRLRRSPRHASVDPN